MPYNRRKYKTITIKLHITYNETKLLKCTEHMTTERGAQIY